MLRSPGIGQKDLLFEITGVIENAGQIVHVTLARFGVGAGGEKIAPEIALYETAASREAALQKLSVGVRRKDPYMQLGDAERKAERFYHPVDDLPPRGRHRLFGHRLGVSEGAAGEIRHDPPVVQERFAVQSLEG